MLAKCFHNNAHFESDYVESKPYFKKGNELTLSNKVPHCSSEAVLYKVQSNDLIQDSEQQASNEDTSPQMNSRHLNRLLQIRRNFIKPPIQIALKLCAKVVKASNKSSLLMSTRTTILSN